jgi:hypothetical protein
MYIYLYSMKGLTTRIRIRIRMQVRRMRRDGHNLPYVPLACQAQGPHYARGPGMRMRIAYAGQVCVCVQRMRGRHAGQVCVCVQRMRHAAVAGLSYVSAYVNTYPHVC